MDVHPPLHLIWQAPKRDGLDPGWWLVKDLNLFTAEVREAVEMARDEGIPDYAARQV
jgi:hypothetical protein